MCLCLFFLLLYSSTLTSSLGQEGKSCGNSVIPLLVKSTQLLERADAERSISMALECPSTSRLRSLITAHTVSSKFNTCVYSVCYHSNGNARANTEKGAQARATSDHFRGAHPLLLGTNTFPRKKIHFPDNVLAAFKSSGNAKMVLCFK